MQVIDGCKVLRKAGETCSLGTVIRASAERDAIRGLDPTPRDLNQRAETVAPRCHHGLLAGAYLRPSVPSPSLLARPLLAQFDWAV